MAADEFPATRGVSGSLAAKLMVEGLADMKTVPALVMTSPGPTAARGLAGNNGLPDAAANNTAIDSRWPMELYVALMVKVTVAV